MIVKDFHTYNHFFLHDEGFFGINRLACGCHWLAAGLIRHAFPGRRGKRDHIRPFPVSGPAAPGTGGPAAPGTPSDQGTCPLTGQCVTVPPRNDSTNAGLAASSAGVPSIRTCPPAST